MRKKTLLAIAVVLLLALGVAAMSVGSAAAPSTSRLRGWSKPAAAQAAAATAEAEAAAKAKGATRLVLILSAPVALREFDAPPVGGELSPGDTVLITEDAFTPAGRRVGHNEVRFTVMHRGEAFGEASFILQGRGQILVEGVIDLANPRGEFAVVGGTGEFRNARGQLFTLPGPTPEQTRLVFALLL